MGQISEKVRERLEKTKSELASTFRGLGKSFEKRAEEVKTAAAGKSEKMMENIGRSGKDWGRSAWTFTKENPISISLAGLGLGILAVMGMRRSDGVQKEVSPGEGEYPGAVGYETGNQWGYFSQEGVGMDQFSEKIKSGKEAATSVVGRAEEGMGQAREKARQAREKARQARERAREAGERVSRQAHRARSGFRQWVQDYPLLAGLGVAALGAVVGLLIPETRREEEIMGETRDEFMERTKEMGRSAAEQVKTTLKQAGEAAKEKVEETLEQGMEKTEEMRTE
jgi:ElaB/YqjD/DUF883 family membrane-anchored ribosome-binding protein